MLHVSITWCVCAGPCAGSSICRVRVVRPYTGTPSPPAGMHSPLNIHVNYIVDVVDQSSDTWWKVGEWTVLLDGFLYFLVQMSSRRESRCQWAMRMKGIPDVMVRSAMSLFEGANIGV